MALLFRDRVKLSQDKGSGVVWCDPVDPTFCSDPAMHVQLRLHR